MKKMKVGLVILAIILAGCVGPQVRRSSMTKATAGPVYPVYYGPKTSIAVVEFAIEVPNVERRLGREITSMFINELLKTARFRVVERTETGITALEREQRLAEEGKLAPGSGIHSGQLTAAKYLIMGAITEIAEGESGLGIAFPLGEDVAVGLGMTNGHVTIEGRVFDTTTGEIIGTFSSSATKPGVALGAVGRIRCNMIIEMGGFKNTSLGEATKAAVRDAVWKVVEIIHPLQ
jgi:curli biogenesis system outer membrane secretion channel CsgG